MTKEEIRRELDVREVEYDENDSYDTLAAKLRDAKASESNDGADAPSSDGARFESTGVYEDMPDTPDPGTVAQVEITRDDLGKR